MNQTNTDRKTLRKAGSRIGWALILYILISFLVSFLWSQFEIGFRFGDQIQAATDPEAQHQMLHQISETMVETGTYLIAGVLAGLLFLLLFFRKQGLHKQLFQKEKAMTTGRFLGIACLFLGLQFVSNCLFFLLEGGLNLVGLSAVSAMEDASAGSRTLSMFLYAGIVAPVAEELIYRGFLMQSLKKYGKGLALVVTSILFGVMHANLPQAMFAALIGLVLGYVAMEYSLGWSIALHVLNNLVFGDLFLYAMKGLNSRVQEILILTVSGILLLIGLVFVIAKRKELAAWVKENLWQKHQPKSVLVCFSMIVFLVSHMVLAFCGLTAI